VCPGQQSSVTEEPKSGMLMLVCMATGRLIDTGADYTRDDLAYGTTGQNAVALPLLPQMPSVPFFRCAIDTPRERRQAGVAEMATLTYRAFLSYSHRDTAWASSLGRLGKKNRLMNFWWQ
jgi:hypothetical protein